MPVASFSSSGLGPGVITAVVRDSGGTPIPGALVVADGPVNRRATTSNGGVVTLVALPIGNYVVRFTRAGYVPFAKSVNVSSDVNASIMRVAIDKNSLGLAQGIASAMTSVSLEGDVNAFATHALSTTPDVLLERSSGGSGVAPTLLGTSAGETRVELDGIPIAGGAASFAALRFRNALGLDSIAVQDGPVVTTPTVQDAIGGIIDYRTPDFGSLSQTSGEFGYSSSFGSFQHFGTAQSFGSLSVIADAVTGGGENRSQTLKARLALSRATSLDLATYGSQSTATVNDKSVSTIAPAYAADIRTTVGLASFQVRAFGSSVSSTVAGSGSLGIANVGARERGVQGSVEVSFGQDTATLSVDKRSDFTTFPQAANAPALKRTYTSTSLRNDLPLGRMTTLELGDQLSGGTSLSTRNDPHVAVAVRPNNAVTIRASAGSSYAVASGEVALVAPAGLALTPETAFGYRLALDDDLSGVDRFEASIFDLRRFDRFATYADARSLGLDVGFSHHPVTSGLGGDASATFQRASAYGPLQPIAREADILGASSIAQIAGDPYTTLHAHLDYRTKHGADFGIAATMFGANNALGPRALGFVDASGSVQISSIGAVRIGVNNIFGSLVTDPYLQPYYTPHEFTVLFQVGLHRTP